MRRVRSCCRFALAAAFATAVPVGVAQAQEAAARLEEPAAEPTSAATAVTKPADEADPTEKNPAAERRSGFLVGTSFGVGPAAANGFPNDARKVNRAAHYTESGVGLGTYGSIWLGGALADGFSFGVGFGGGTIYGDGVESGGGGIFFHADAFPLFSFGGALRDLGVGLEAGTGGATTVDDQEEVLIDGGGAAYVSSTIFWEGLELWRIRSGPYLGAHYMWSDTVRRPQLLVGFRTTLYTGP
jgi:hypothetical protein